MEGLTVMDRHHHQSHIPYHGARHFDPRPAQLPIPIIRDRHDPYDDVPRQSMALSLSSRSDEGMASPLNINFWDAQQPHQSFAGLSHQNADSRPSLPSLRTVLRETSRSPPTTPHHGASLQPYPKEPSYDQSIYKPSSLYPNKRTRTDSGYHAQDADRKNSEISPATLPLLGSHQSDRSRTRHQLDLPSLTGSSPDSYRTRSSDIHFDDRFSMRDSLSHRASPDSCGRPSYGPSSPRLAPTHGAGFHSLQRSKSAREGPADRMSLSAYEPSLTQSRSPSLALTEDGSRRASYYSHPGTLQQPFQSDVRRHSLLNMGPSSGYREEYSSMSRMDGPHGYNSNPYPYSQAFFVPSHYEYQNGKSRKRSNLPKQSTEIMKRWFDDNLQNPYPSEEQKRHFAAVAGINLTQVSNWFINHRRRCPELREKRDKGRAGSRDESV